MKKQGELYYDLFKSPLGPLWIVSGNEGLCFLLWNRSHSDFLLEMQTRVGRRPQKNSKRLAFLMQQLKRYFLGKNVLFDSPIAFLEGSPFQKKVWRKLMEIPYGEVRSYQWVSDQLSMKGAARAVGNACGKNPLPVVVPCHRVVRQDGSIGGYTGGAHIKNHLLQMEGAL